MCIIRDKDHLQFECEGATVGDVKRDITTHLSVSIEHVSLYALTEHGLNLDAADDALPVKETDTFYMEIVQPQRLNDEHSALQKAPIGHSDVGQSLREYHATGGTQIPESTTLLPETMVESPLAANKKMPADSFCFI